MQFIIGEDEGIKKLVCYITDERRFDDFSYEMICENEIKGLAGMIYTERDGKDVIQYDISKYDTLRNYLSFSVSLDNLLCIFKQIITIVEELESYLIDKSLLVTDIGRIYYDRTEELVKMIYSPVFEAEDMQLCEERLFVLFREIILSAKFVIGNDDRYITELLNGLSDVNDSSVEDFKEIVCSLIERIGTDCEKKVYSYSATGKSECYYEEQSMLPRKTDVVEESALIYATDNSSIENKGFKSFIRKLFFKEEHNEIQEDDMRIEDVACFDNDEQEPEIIKKDNDETVVLMRGSMGSFTPYLIRKLTGERISVNKRVFRIGKDKRYADYIISDNAAVSRAHAELMIKDGNIYITDEDSLNGTYINGERLIGRQEKEAKNGDVIMIADEEYVLYC